MRSWSYEGILGARGGGLTLLALRPTRAGANGESVDGFPNWQERVLLEWTNRARADPDADLANCGANCGEAQAGACYEACPRCGSYVHDTIFLHEPAVAECLVATNAPGVR